MTKRNHIDTALMPYEQVARMYNIKHPKAKITRTTAQRIGVGALMKLRYKLKGIHQ